MEMHMNIEKNSGSVGTWMAIGHFLFFYSQGLNIVETLIRRGICFSDYKPENMLTLFFHRDIIMSDFGVSYEYTDEDNQILGLTQKYATQDAIKSCEEETLVKKDVIIENDFFAIQTTFDELFEAYLKERNEDKEYDWKDVAQLMSEINKDRKLTEESITAALEHF